MDKDDPKIPEMNPPGYSSGEEGGCPVRTPEKCQPSTPMERGEGGRSSAQTGVPCCAVLFPDQNENPEKEPMEEGNGVNYDA